MRHAFAPGALALLFALHGPAFALAGADIRYVTSAEAEVRSGPSLDSKFYPTNKLPRGASVEVVEEMPGGWLKIRPPEGSFSYINTRFLEHISANQPNFVVALDNVEVPVYIGSAIVKDRPNNIGVKLKRGAQVTSKGKAMSEGSETLLPIEAPHGEVRYVRADAVTRTPPPAGSVVTAGRPTTDANGHSSFTPTGALVPSGAPSATPPVSADELWQRAMIAQRAGQTTEAIRLFNQVSVVAVQSNPYMATTAQKWVQYLQYGHQTYGSSGVAANPVSSASAGGRSYPLAAETTPVRLNPPPGSNPVWADGTTAGSAAKPAMGTTASSQLPAGWVAFHGRLRPAGRAVENVKTYVIEMEESGYVRPVAYVHAGPGVDLASQVGRVVEVWGPAVYRGDLRTNYITAQRVFAP
jgi:hypothetical protein